MLGKTGKNNISVCYQCRNEDISEDARYCKICGIGLRVMELVSVFNFETGEKELSFLTGKECLFLYPQMLLLQFLYHLSQNFPYRILRTLSHTHISLLDLQYFLTSRK